MKLLLTFLLILNMCSISIAQNVPVEGADLGAEAVFDDRALINGYTDKFAEESQDVLLQMIGDDSLGPYKSAAAIRVFKQKYGNEVLSADKAGIIKILLRRLNKTDSSFVQVEIFHTLIILDHYQYFESMMPSMLQKLDHYNAVVRDLAYDDIQEVISQSTRTREARIVFNTLRKMFFLSRNRLSAIDKPDLKLRQKLNILRWAIKVLGTQELKKLPSEVIGLL